MKPSARGRRQRNKMKHRVKGDTVECLRASVFQVLGHFAAGQKQLKCVGSMFSDSRETTQVVFRRQKKSGDKTKHLRD